LSSISTCESKNNKYHCSLRVHDSTLQGSGSAAHKRQHEPVASSQQHRGHLERVDAAVVAPVVAAAQTVPAVVAAAAAAAVVAAVAAAAVAQSEHAAAAAAAAAAAVVAAVAVVQVEADSVEVAGCESLDDVRSHSCFHGGALQLLET
jgi:hypothetical protein